MPISMSEYRTPTFSTYQEKKPFSTKNNAKYQAASGYIPMRRYRSESFPQAGYNPEANSATVKKINLDRDDISFEYR